MDVNFGRSAPFSIGVEEEFQLLSPESYELVSRFDEVAEAAGDERVKPELLQSVLEVATSVGRNVPEAIEEARELRTRLRDAAAERGTLIASAGTHPFSRYEHQDVTDAPRYVRLVEKMQWIAERELLFALHVPGGIRSVAALVALVQSLAATLAERYEREDSLPTQPITLVSENKWRAARYGLDADLIWLERDEERPAREALRHLVELAEPAARRLGCADELALVEEVLRRGTGADEQRRVYAETESLLAVAQFLARTTTEALTS